MTASELFDKAVLLALEEIKAGRFVWHSEQDIQAIIFHHAVTLTDPSVRPVNIHAEPTRAGFRPDLVVGNDEVFSETKLSEAAAGGYTQAIGMWEGDIAKLRQ